MKNNEVVYEFNKNSAEKVKLEIGYFMGHKIIGLRLYFLADSVTNVWIPTRKGISMSISHFPHLLKAFEEAKKVIEAKK